MPARGYTAITIREELYNLLKKKYEEDFKGKKVKVSLTSFINDLLWEVIERDEVLKNYSPYLEEVAVEGDRVIIKDNRIDRIAELVLKDKELYCLLDDRKDCVHIGFAWAIPKVYKAMKLQGSKSPN